MKKKVVFNIFIAVLTFAAVLNFAYSGISQELVKYIPESCTSDVSCLDHYSDYKSPYSGKIFCCSENTPNITGKAKQ